MKAQSGRVLRAETHGLMVYEEDTVSIVGVNAQGSVLLGPDALQERLTACGDILEVRIVDVRPRPSANPKYAGKAFGSNAAANWGFQYKDLITEPKPREVVTIYELDPGHISASSGWRRKKPTLSTAFRRAISAARWIIGASARGRRCTILLRFPARLCRSAIPMPRKAIPNSAARRTRRIIHDRSGISDTYLIERSRRARRDSWRN